MTHIMSHGFQACGSFKHLTCFMSCYWLKVVKQMTHRSQLMNLLEILVMSHKRWMTKMDKLSG